jgi:hypothetical protein
VTKQFENIAAEITRTLDKITIFDIGNFWAMPLEKPTRGKPVKEIFFLLSS